MDASFWLKIGLSFVVGSLWVTLTTLSAERFGSKVGGLIGGLPSTVVIALLFIGITQSPAIAAEATTSMPLAQGFNGLFVLVFILMIRRGLSAALIASLLVWFINATILYLLDLQSFLVSLIGWLILLVLCYLAVERWMRISTQGKQAFSYQPSQLVWRALFGGSVISLAVIMGKLGGPLLGGIFGSFPAMFLSTLVITARTGGGDFSRSVGKSMLISGLINVPIYEIMVRALYPSIGLGWGTLISLLGSMATGYLTYRFITTRMTYCGSKPELGISPKALNKIISHVPGFSAFHVPEVPATQADIIKCPHQPP
jgi:uncharacterized membrane protein (GlpM family)